ncbi:uncharacterized protein LOC109810223 [Cajanus cajan]|uniref:Uncharacterized protein n=1 Tax=Cajanus cajan TaxID=3821 RepID=A0A151SFX5_CAJCA|nr:uncharacterized protein LOC109810223 [Cajanus cajan]KYP53638.1 hypothetical protein KK1_024533 [Cajanus cajan]
MASFIPSSDLGANVIVTKEEFFIFHNIDRQLFSRLVVGLGHDTSQSTHVMAFIMWLEKQCKDMKMVKNILQWPEAKLDSLAGEAILVLNCIESSQFPHDGVVNDKGLPLIKSIMRNNAISLKYFYDNRVTIIDELTKLLSNVCERAFIDIVQQVQYTKAMEEQHLKIANIYGAGPYIKQMVYYTPLPGVNIVPHQQVAISTPQWSEGSYNTSSVANPPQETTYDVSVQKECNPNFNELMAMLNHTSENKEVPVDDRIIFMTFSRGYLISEVEVRDFFLRMYGDIVEALHMQDVVPPEQPLYARVVIRAEAIHMIDHILESTNKVKLSINGKHAWARKYVRKDNKSTIEKSPVTSRAPSPSSIKTFY